MRDVMLELKHLRLHGMAGAWAELSEHSGESGLDAARWLLEHLLQAETPSIGACARSSTRCTWRSSRCTAT